MTHRCVRWSALTVMLFAGLWADYGLAARAADEADGKVFVGYVYRRPAKINFGLYTHLCHAFVVAEDDPQSLALKTEWDMKQGFRGVFFWQIGGDLLADGTNPLQEAARKKLDESQRGSGKE